MSTSLNVILKRFAVLFVVVAVLFGITMIFTYDVIKIQWVGFMAIHPPTSPWIIRCRSRRSRSPSRALRIFPTWARRRIPCPQTLLLLAAALSFTHQLLCVPRRRWQGQRPCGRFPRAQETDRFHRPIGQSLSDGAIFMVITEGRPGAMPPLNENLLVRESWDVVNYIRELQKK